MFLAKTLLVAATVATGALTAPPRAGEPQPLPARAAAATSPVLQHIVRRLVHDGAPGALAVVRTPSGMRRAQSGLGRRRPRLAMAATDRFRVASITKTFVATVVLQLVGEGKLRLDDPVERWLPGLVPNGRAITIRQLLDHASGLFDYYDDKAFVRSVIAHPGRTWPPRKLVAIATRHRPLFAPGQGWSYSNTNYILLGLTVEAVTGTALGQQLEQRLFGPLGLAETSFPAGLQIEGAHAHGYIGFATLPRLHSLFDATSVESTSVAWAAGGIVSTGDDVTSLYAALLGGRVLVPPLLAAMKTPAPGARYGLGLLQADTPCGRAYGHEGVATGYRSVAYARPGGKRVALVMVNIDNTWVSQSELDTAAATALCSG